MHVEHPDTPAAIAAMATPFLAKREAEHGLLLGLLGGAFTTPAPRWAYAAAVRDGPDVAAVALRTHDRLVLSRVTRADAAALLARDALDGERRGAVVAVIGPESSVEPFVAASGAPWRRTMRQGVYTVRTVVPARAVEGTRRPAAPRDRDALVAFSRALHEEALGETPSTDAIAAGVDAKIASGALHVWDVRGAPVASAAAVGPTPNGIRLNHVYTPPALRGRGYASALVASLSRHLLDEGRAFVFLHTDLSNPISNRVYERIGYVRVAEVEMHEPT